MVCFAGGQTDPRATTCGDGPGRGARAREIAEADYESAIRQTNRLNVPIANEEERPVPNRDYWDDLARARKAHREQLYPRTETRLRVRDEGDATGPQQAPVDSMVEHTRFRVTELTEMIKQEQDRDEDANEAYLAELEAARIEAGRELCVRNHPNG